MEDMTVWTISSTTNFLNALLDLPRQVSKKLPEVIKTLQKNPDNEYAVKIKGYDKDKLLRFYLTRKYRLFYTYDAKCVKLLNILKREKDTYKNPDQIAESKVTTFLNIDDKDELDYDTTDRKGLLSLSQLEHWLIPKQYLNDLLKIQNADELLDLTIPSHYLERIIDNLYPPKPLEEINNRAEFIIKNPEDLERFLTGETSEFLLKLSEQQEEFLNIESDGPILIKGKPGTGKSILALYRVEKLVKSKVRNILFTTHTPSLVNYSTQLLNKLLERPLQEFNIEVNTVDNIAKRYYAQKYGEPQVANEKFSFFVLDSVIKTIRIKQSLHKEIIKLGQKYLLEEILNVIEARGIDTLDWYKKTDRFGRRCPLDKPMREAVWSIYEEWKSLIANSGYITIEQLRKKALEVACEQQSKPYQAVIIDEAQDLSPVALRFLVQLASSDKGKEIYLTADVSQSLYQRVFAWDLIQQTIKFSGTTRTLTRIFRSTEQIGKACPKILLAPNAGEVDPTLWAYSKLKGNKPKILLTDALAQQAQKIKEFFQESAHNFSLPVHSGAILVPDSELGKFIAQQLTFKGLRSEYMEPQELDITKSCIKVLTLHASKGLEFPFVVVVGLAEGILPQLTDNIPNDDKQEVLNQDRRLFYVGCSRAMCSLLVCGSKSNPSQFLSPLMSKSNSYWEVEELQ